MADAVPPLGHGQGAPDYDGVPKVMRPDIYLEAMKEMGVAVKVAEEQKITLFDGVFDPARTRRSTRDRSFP